MSSLSADVLSGLLMLMKAPNYRTVLHKVFKLIGLKAVQQGARENQFTHIGAVGLVSLLQALAAGNSLQAAIQTAIDTATSLPYAVNKVNKNLVGWSGKTDEERAAKFLNVIEDFADTLAAAGVGNPYIEPATRPQLKKNIERFSTVMSLLPDKEEDHGGGLIFDNGDLQGGWLLSKLHNWVKDKWQNTQIGATISQYAPKALTFGAMLLGNKLMGYSWTDPGLYLKSAQMASLMSEYITGDVEDALGEGIRSGTGVTDAEWNKLQESRKSLRGRKIRDGINAALQIGGSIYDQYEAKKAAEKIWQQKKEYAKQMHDFVEEQNNAAKQHAATTNRIAYQNWQAAENLRMKQIGEENARADEVYKREKAKYDADMENYKIRKANYERKAKHDAKQTRLEAELKNAEWMKEHQGLFDKNIYLSTTALGRLGDRIKGRTIPESLQENIREVGGPYKPLYQKVEAPVAPVEPVPPVHKAYIRGAERPEPIPIRPQLQPLPAPFLEPEPQLRQFINVEPLVTSRANYLTQKYAIEELEKKQAAEALKNFNAMMEQNARDYYKQSASVGPGTSSFQPKVLPYKPTATSVDLLSKPTVYGMSMRGIGPLQTKVVPTNTADLDTFMFTARKKDKKKKHSRSKMSS